MHIGYFVFVTDYSMPIVELARALEERGFESLFVPEHTHIPTSRRSPWAGGPKLPRHYSHTLDPFVSLAAAAAVTTKLRLGTGICLLTEHDPIVTAQREGIRGLCPSCSPTTGMALTTTSASTAGRRRRSPS